MAAQMCKLNTILKRKLWAIFLLLKGCLFHVIESLGIPRFVFLEVVKFKPKINMKICALNNIPIHGKKII